MKKTHFATANDLNPVLEFTGFSGELLPPVLSWESDSTGGNSIARYSYLLHVLQKTGPHIQESCGFYGEASQGYARIPYFKLRVLDC